LLLAGWMLLPAAALAQSSAPPIRDREQVTFNEIERGVYFNVAAGPSFLLNAPAPAGGLRPFAPGQSLSVELGYDIADFLSLGVFVNGTASRASSLYLGYSTPATGIASGDFLSLTPGLTGKLSFLGFNDANEVRRTWLYLRVGAGYSMFTPSALVPADIMAFGGPGIEYFTRLRHFSIGLEVTGHYLLKNAAFGFAVSPNLRYAF
jgi:hypothetical protein